MKDLVIENKGKQMIIRLDKSRYDGNYLISLVKRLQIESIAKRSEFSSEILDIAEEMKEEWWKLNGESFLKGVRK